MTMGERNPKRSVRMSHWVVFREGFDFNCIQKIFAPLSATSDAEAPLAIHQQQHKRASMQIDLWAKIDLHMLNDLHSTFLHMSLPLQKPTPRGNF